MNNIAEITMFNPCTGVSLYFAHDTCIDIDVEPGIETVFFCGQNEINSWLSRTVSLRGINKVFPDVKAIVIGSDIKLINISNYMFPNVRIINSKGNIYKSGPYLIEDCWPDDKLCNVFCIKENEDVEAVSASIIGDYAFEGCEKTDGFFNENNFINKIEHNAFAGSGFLNLPYENGMKSICNIIIDVDTDAEEMMFKKRDNLSSKNKYICPDGMDLKNIKRASFYNFDDISITFPLPKTISVMKIGRRINLLYQTINDTNVVSYEAPAESEYFSAIDGILYSKDGKKLIKCPGGKTGDIIIPEGVENINDYAFSLSKISSVSFPESMNYIGRNAFLYSEISRIDFGNGIAYIGGHEGMVFSGCKKLTEVEIPSNVIRIGNGCFWDCTNLKKVTLHDGLQSIGEAAFLGCENLKELSIPGTVVRLGNESLLDIETIKIPKVISGILYASTDTSYRSANHSVKKIITDNGLYYIPIQLKPALLYRISQYECTYGRIPDDIYKHAITTELKQDTAYYIYKNRKNNVSNGVVEIQKYLKRCAKKIAIRYMDADKQKFTEFLNEGLLSKAALKELLKLAEQRDDTSIAAYLLMRLTSRHLVPVSGFELMLSRPSKKYREPLFCNFRSGI